VGLKLVSAPANDAVTLVEAKSHLVVEHTEHDSLIGIYISACQGFVDGPNGYLGRALIDQTWDYTLDHFPGHNRGWRFGRCRCCYNDAHRERTIEIPLAPLIEVVSVAYIDTAGDEQTLDSALYTVAGVGDPQWPGRVVRLQTGSWPQTAHQPDAVRIRFRAGYLDTTMSPAEDAVPFPIKAAILLHVGDLYKNRETTLDVRAVAQLPWAAEQLLKPHRLYLDLA
jgi:hypothetical protein